MTECTQNKVLFLNNRNTTIEQSNNLNMQLACKNKFTSHTAKRINTNDKTYRNQLTCVSQQKVFIELETTN